MADTPDQTPTGPSDPQDSDDRRARGRQPHAVDPHDDADKRGGVRFAPLLLPVLLALGAAIVIIFVLL